MLLLLGYVHRLVAFSTIPDNVNTALDFSKFYNKLESERNAGRIFNPGDDTQVMQDIISEVSHKGLLTFEYYECVFSFLLFWYFFASLFIAMFSLLYYRKFVDK